jgi:hypothetical protein
VYPQNPLWVQALYVSALVLQTFDTYCFLTFSYFPFFHPKRGHLHPYSKFSTRAYACLLFPYILLCFLLRTYHIRETDVGFALGACFALFHGSCVVMYSYCAATVGTGGFKVEPFGVIMAVHTIWTLWAVCGYLWA